VIFSFLNWIEVLIYIIFALKLITMYFCKICPFECGVDRYTRLGVCGLPKKILVSHYQQHFFEEPFISGIDYCEDKGGSGTIFFSGCNGRCVFCQNYKISNGSFGGVETSFEKLFEICEKLIDKGVHNINFVSPTPYTEMLRDFLRIYKTKIPVPIIWNSNCYEKDSSIRELAGLVDVYLPDLKYFDDSLAVKYSSMPSYFKWASSAIKEMVSQVSWPEIGDDGFIKKGVVIRHLVLPGLVAESKKVLEWISEKFGSEAYVALMAQYYPTYKACEYPEINRTLSQDEYNEISDYFVGLGFEDGLVQELCSADSIYTPEF